MEGATPSDPKTYDAKPKDKRIPSRKRERQKRRQRRKQAEQQGLDPNKDLKQFKAGQDGKGGKGDDDKDKERKAERRAKARKKGKERREQSARENVAHGKETDQGNEEKKEGEAVWVPKKRIKTKEEKKARKEYLKAKQRRMRMRKQLKDHEVSGMFSKISTSLATLKQKEDWLEYDATRNEVKKHNNTLVDQCFVNFSSAEADFARHYFIKVITKNRQRMSFNGFKLLFTSAGIGELLVATQFLQHTFQVIQNLHLAAGGQQYVSKKKKPGEEGMEAAHAGEVEEMGDAGADQAAKPKNRGKKKIKRKRRKFLNCSDDSESLDDSSWWEESEPSMDSEAEYNELVKAAQEAAANQASAAAAQAAKTVNASRTAGGSEQAKISETTSLDVDKEDGSAEGASDSGSESGDSGSSASERSRSSSGSSSGSSSYSSSSGSGSLSDSSSSGSSNSDSANQEDRTPQEMKAFSQHLNAPIPPTQIDALKQQDTVQALLSSLSDAQKDIMKNAIAAFHQANLFAKFSLHGQSLKLGRKKNRAVKQFHHMTMLSYATAVSTLLKGPLKQQLLFLYSLFDLDDDGVVSAHDIFGLLPLLRFHYIRSDVLKVCRAIGEKAAKNKELLQQRKSELDRQLRAKIDLKVDEPNRVFLDVEEGLDKLVLTKEEFFEAFRSQKKVEDKLKKIRLVFKHAFRGMASDMKPEAAQAKPTGKDVAGKETSGSAPCRRSSASFENEDQIWESQMWEKASKVCKRLKAEFLSFAGKGPDYPKLLARYFEKHRDLIEQGFLDLNRSVEMGSGSTLLHTAAFYRNVEVMKTLLLYGADPNFPNLKGNTPLHLACEQGHKANGLACIAVLLRNGGDMTITNGMDVNPKQCIINQYVLKYIASLDREDDTEFESVHCMPKISRLLGFLLFGQFRPLEDLSDEENEVKELLATAGHTVAIANKVVKAFTEGVGSAAAGGSGGRIETPVKALATATSDTRSSTPTAAAGSNPVAPSAGIYRKKGVFGFSGGQQNSSGTLSDAEGERALYSLFERRQRQNTDVKKTRRKKNNNSVDVNVLATGGIAASAPESSAIQLQMAKKFVHLYSFKSPAAEEFARMSKNDKDLGAERFHRQMQQKRSEEEEQKQNKAEQEKWKDIELIASGEYHHRNHSKGHHRHKDEHHHSHHGGSGHHHHHHHHHHQHHQQHRCQTGQHPHLQSRTH